MLGILIQIALSWLLIRIVEHESLSVLGYQPIRKRILQLLVGFSLAAIVCGIAQLIESNLTGVSWQVNKAFDFRLFFEGVWWNLKSVLFEEFIFRGALLYIAIKRLGTRAGLALSAASFGIYHWFSYGIIGSPVAMVLVFVVTGLIGLVWAYSFSATGSMALPVGLHFGWNYVLNSIFSKGPIGIQFLVPLEPENYSQLSGISWILNFILPAVIFAFLSYKLASRMSKVHISPEKP